VASTTDPDIETALAQLTTARWYLDRAVSAEPEARRRDIREARQIHDHWMSLLPQMSLPADQLRKVQRELGELQARLHGAGEL
jgi:hypothetical protein